MTREKLELPCNGFNEWLRDTQNIWSASVPEFYTLPQETQQQLIREFNQWAWDVALRNSGGNGQG